ncbi:MAG: hypothetical protein QM756_15745 [Polyangiaceae bacterium]
MAWALEQAGGMSAPPPRVLLAAGAVQLAESLRSAGIAAASAPEAQEGLAYARAWRYSHVLEAVAGEFSLVDSETQHRQALPKDPAALVATLTAQLQIGAGGS